MARLAAAVLAAALVAAPSVARGNGGNSHAWITVHAVEHLPDGELRRMLERPELLAALINGAVFPDGGYVVEDDYGEMAHWEPFVQAYVEWMLASQDRPFTEGVAAEYVAFLMGVASHGMADQVFDATFMDAARIHDAENWSEELFDGFDTATDVMLVEETGVDFTTLDVWAPVFELSDLYLDAFGYQVSADRLDGAQELLHRLVLAYGVSAASNPEDVAAFRAQYPWASERLMEAGEVGSPPCEGEVVADYMLALWDRLHEASGPQNHIIATYPRDGSAGHPTDYSLVESQVVIVFGSGIRRDQLDGRFEIRDGAGHVYEITADTQWGASVANLVKLRALEDWAEDQTFTVTVQPGLETNDGMTIEEAWSFTFSTTPTDEPSDPTSDPTPHVGEPEVGSSSAAGGGCCGAGGGSGSVGIAALVAFGLVRRRRRS
jgi:uncharacterized protein (TIGR03382 family)